jgi:hypothetical protein
MSVEPMNYGFEWATLCAERREHLAKQPGGQYTSLDSQSRIDVLGEYKMMCFSERIRVRSRAIWKRPTAIEAIQLYVINKHHWPLDEVENLEVSDFVFLLREELEELLLSPEEFEPIRQQVAHTPELEIFLPHTAK